MELLTLNSTPGSSTIFQPVKLIENYDSLIWSERYWSSGDFELISSDVNAAMRAMPLESFIGLRESTVPMVVESHKLDKPKGKHSRVTIRGRSFESVLDRRGTQSVLSGPVADPRPIVTFNADKVSDAAYKMLRSVLGDIARANLPEAVPINVNDRIAEINLLLPTDYTTGTLNPYEVKFGNMLKILLEMLEVNHHGIRAVRPPATGGKTTVDLEIYNGADLRNTAVFDARFDQFDSATYLLSFQGSTNVAYVYGPNGVNVRQKNIGTEPSGLNRRVILMDEASDASLNSEAARLNRGLVELYKNNATALFDGETSIQIAQRYNKPVAQGGFGLGDILQLNGEYGLSRIVRVEEWIRTSDSTGESAYPTFQAIDD